MPELPEVETQVRDLQVIVGKKILKITSNTQKAFKPSFSKLKKQLENKKILAISRRAKFIVFSLSGDLILLMHFRMTGHFLLSKNSTALEKHIRHTLQLSGGIYLQFSDIRKFATLKLVRQKDFADLPEIAKLGPEPLEKSFTAQILEERFRGKRGTLKAVLLDQSFVAGIGNIYADEICFEARLHPAMRVEKLNKQSIVKIFRAIRNQLRQGVRNRGTTIGEYVDARGRAGKNQNTLFAYRRHGKPCKICGQEMQKMKIVQRTTSFCPKCQKNAKCKTLNVKYF